MKILALSLSFCKYALSGKPGEMLKEAGISFDINSTGKKYSEEDIIKVVEGYDGIVTGADPITRNVIQKGVNLKIIAKNGVGYDNIDIPEATARGIYVTYTPGAVEQTVADTTIGLMLDLARNITKGTQSIRNENWERLMGTDVWEKKLGIIGLGKIGKNVAYRAKGFNMEVYAYDPFIDKDYCQKNNIIESDLDQIFRNCDFITIHSMLTDESRHLVNKERLGMMKNTAFLINTSRGGAINEADLIDALKEKKIAGAALDVFETEPLPKESPFFDLDNVILNAHIAGLSHSANFRAGMMVTESVVAALKGEVPPYVLNKEAKEARDANG